jgi:hypothetical protein
MSEICWTVGRSNRSTSLPDIPSPFSTYVVPGSEVAPRSGGSAKSPPTVEPVQQSNRQTFDPRTDVGIIGGTTAQQRRTMRVAQPRFFVQTFDRSTLPSSFAHSGRPGDEVAT